MTRPPSIIWFERLYLGALAIGVLNTAFRWNELNAQIAAAPNSAAFGTWFLPVTLIVGWGITLLLWFFTAQRASVVAKWIITVFLAIGLIGFAISLATGRLPGGFAIVVTVVTLALNAAAVWMLFRPDANAWFAGRPTNLSDTFS